MNLTVLDVGHGNSALVVEDSAVTIIDAAPGPVVSDALRQAEIASVDQVIISHADNDHCGGLVGLLLDEEITIDRVWINTDVSKTTKIWGHVQRALADARRRSGLKVLNGLTSDHDINGDHKLFRLEVLAPNPMLTLAGGPGARDAQGRVITTNSMSVVIRIWHNNVPFALFAADIDALGLSHLLEETSDIRARVLVFPHHGGMPGPADAQEFATKLSEAVRPELVIFSIGRGRFDNPSPGIVSAVRAAVPDVHIVCTQLSEFCAQILPDGNPGHLSGRVSGGAAQNACCGGSLDLNLDGGDTLGLPSRGGHTQFVQLNATTPLCRPAE